MVRQFPATDYLPPLDPAKENMPPDDENDDPMSIVPVPSSNAVAIPREYEWKGSTVPEPVYNALSTPYRGQTFGKKHSYLLEQFHEVPEFVPGLDTQLTPAKNVRTKLVCKFESACTSTASPGDVNTGKLLPKLLANPNVPDEVKQTLASGAHANCAVQWRESFHKKRRSVENSGFAALAYAELQTVEEGNEAAIAEHDRPKVLDARTVDLISMAESETLLPTVA
ncbi:hypothetical protein CYMTET_25213 [Cymbomonas tetramitiformis]|uniref:Uncharacterized protein n=1 Tax=Cymbomonas tetramitiformis TaxID=36881 RepID=A0AAE0FUK5_9CHLO|nr:hypothetical protein CYMTET_25213 [Cymbomonas tetramitiformis]